MHVRVTELDRHVACYGPIRAEKALSTLNRDSVLFGDPSSLDPHRFSARLEFVGVALLLFDACFLDRNSNDQDHFTAG